VIRRKPSKESGKLTFGCGLRRKYDIDVTSLGCFVLDREAVIFFDEGLNVEILIELCPMDTLTLSYDFEFRELFVARVLESSEVS
jgi:hypothetical protein